MHWHTRALAPMCISNQSAFTAWRDPPSGASSRAYWSCPLRQVEPGVSWLSYKLAGRKARPRKQAKVRARATLPRTLYQLSNKFRPIMWWVLDIDE